jgi:hypothetical protein
MRTGPAAAIGVIWRCSGDIPGGGEEAPPDRSGSRSLGGRNDNFSGAHAEGGGESGKVVCLSTPASFESVMTRLCVSLGVSEEIGWFAHRVMDERGIVTTEIVRRVKGMGRENVDVGRMLFIRDKGDESSGWGMRSG